MQVSVETTSSIERRMTIGVPAEQVESEVQKRLQETAKSVKINGFRPGKVPFNVVKKRYGAGVRQEVVGEIMRNAYVEALAKEEINPAGYPKFEAKSIEDGKDLEFVAVFEVNPEIELADMSGISVEREKAEIKKTDVNTMIDVLRRQHATPKSVKRKAKKKDILTVDFKGTVDGEEFEGGSAEDSKITLGSGQMIPGFEDGLIGSKPGEELTLDVTFPEDYQNTELAGKAAQFAVTVKANEEQVLPEMNQEFFSKYGIEDADEEKFTAEILKNMERELAQAVNNKVKQQIIDQLVKANEFEVPGTMIDQEIDRMREDAVRQFGGGAEMKAENLPAELFKDQAGKRVRTGLVFSAIVKTNELKVDADQVNDKITQIASTYQDPEQVVEWYKGNQEQMAQVESVVLEDQVVELVLSKATVKDKKVSYEDAVKPAAPAPVEK